LLFSARGLLPERLSQPVRFQVQQLALDRQAATKADQLAVFADNPVAGDDDRQWIAVIGHAHGAGCPGAVDGFSDVAVAGGLAVRNAFQGALHGGAVTGQQQGADRCVVMAIKTRACHSQPQSRP